MKKKSFIIIMIIFVIVVIGSTISLARDSMAYSAEDIYNGESTPADLKTPVSQVLGVIKYIGFAAAVIVLSYIGIKYILATPEGKAELKKQLIPYAIGIIILFAGSAFAYIIGDLSKTYVK